jgi:DnaJ homologue, subfamily C, member 28, conserved domain
MAYESFIDKQIREAQERGDWKDLPGYGKPLPKRDTNDPDWWVKSWIEREGISMADALPTGLALRRAVEALPDVLDSMRSEREVREAVRDLNDRVVHSRQRPGGGPPVVVRTVDVEAAVSDWKKRRGRA